METATNSLKTFVDAVYLRPDKTLPPKQAHALPLIAGKGIDSDCHADPLSPRQVLIALSGPYIDFHLPPNTLRENILLRSNPEFNGAQMESGDTLSLDGGTLKLRLTFPCEPCGRLNKKKPNLCRDIKEQRGWLARVVCTGVLRAGDTLRITKAVYPPFSDDWHERVLAVARLLPPDRSLSYLKLALLAGVASSYCRAFPRLLRTHKLPTERIVPSSTLPSLFPAWTGEEVFTPEPLSHEPQVDTDQSE